MITLAKAKETYTFTIKHEGHNVTIITDAKKHEAYNALLRAVITAYRAKPKELEKIVNTLVEYKDLALQKKKVEEIQTKSTFEVFEELMQVRHG